MPGSAAEISLEGAGLRATSLLRLRGVAATLLICGAIVGTSCGSDDGGDDASAQSGDADQVMTVMRDWRKAFEAGNGEDACKLMTAKYQAELTKALAEVFESKATECPGAVEYLAKSPDVFEDMYPSALKTTVKGDKATISGYVSHLKERQTAHFVRQDGEWKLALWFRATG